ncbi:DUF4126 family protein [Pedobacter sp. HMF7647]|uniref:DUF4126 family protein n=1 Tax=Hufsiella arboris TaxID=2695275 RepID=A0A7K1YC19_9SPHI|nr:STAS/SEC14 domain-containing protein [Hufsiella arboris]MXV52134.1 DUF4126 family protein [Hufsiella arboris]
MIEQFNDLPSNAAGFRATGQVTKDDYEKVVIPAINDLISRTGKINFLLFIDTELPNFSLGAWFNDLKLGLQNFSKWNRIAIVSNYDLVKYFSDAFTAIVPGQSKGFKTADLEYAKLWIAEDGRVLIVQNNFRNEILAGIMAGMRASAAPAFTSRLCQRSPKSLQDSYFKFMESPVTSAITGTNVALEFIGDKLPWTPNRTKAGGVIARVLSGALSAAVISKKQNRPALAGGIIGAVSAIGSTYLFFYLRKRLVKQANLPDPLIGLMEDLVVLYLGTRILKER